MPNKLASDIQITMNKISISFATSVKYLGIEIESSLKLFFSYCKNRKNLNSSYWDLM